MLLSAILTPVQRTLIDVAGVTWPISELEGYANEAIRTICFLKPDAYTIRDYIPMVAGTNQALPSGGIAILDLGQNEVSKRAATLVDADLLDHQNRFWQAGTQERDVQHWAADPREPTRFNVTPPNDGTGSVLCVYGAVPADVTSAQAIPLADSYQRAIECFVLARAYEKNSRQQDLSKSAAKMQEFLQLLGIKSTAQVTVAPKVRNQPGV